MLSRGLANSKSECGALRADRTAEGRGRADRLREQGDNEDSRKVMREAEAMARNYKEQLESSRRDSSDDVRASLRQLQRDLQELREQFRQLQEQRGSNRN